MVTLGETLHAATDLGDHPRAFVSADHRIRLRLRVAGDQMMVGVAQPRRGKRYMHLTFPLSR
ncbi:hypothetical protein APR09_005255 [Nocardia amikacinitolerans]|nr:hypothetical protein [Nocardia amikacinitolerans]